MIIDLIYADTSVDWADVVKAFAELGLVENEIDRNFAPELAELAEKLADGGVAGTPLPRHLGAPARAPAPAVRANRVRSDSDLGSLKS